MKILIIDNYDSFTYNLVYLVRELGYESSMEVVRNDKFELNHVNDFDKILLSPGPGIPEEAGLMPEVIREFAPSKDILGICLGHQGIAEGFGGKLRNLDRVLHGIQGEALLSVNKTPLFKNLPNKIKVAHYHSWVVDEGFVPDCFEVTARTEQGLVMGISHKEFKVEGLQFHPESILTEFGKEIIDNWINR